MNLYTALHPDGRTEWCGTQALAKAINREITPVDFPTDKPNLLDELNRLQRIIDDLTLAAQANTKPIADAEAKTDDLGAHASCAGCEAVLKADESGLCTSCIKLRAAEIGHTLPNASQAVQSGDICETISNADEASFGWILVATIERLGELRFRGWQPLKAIHKLYKGNGALERGLGALIMLDPRDADTGKPGSSNFAPTV